MSPLSNVSWAVLQVVVRASALEINATSQGTAGASSFALIDVNDVKMICKI